MKISELSVLSGAAWTIAGYGVSVVFRFGTNVVLARLLAPEIFGVMVIVNSIKIGMELISDVGIGQNIIHNEKGDAPAFYNTAWTIQAVRGFLLFLALAALSGPVASFYDVPALAVQVTALTMVFTGVTSTSVFLLERHLRLARRNIFEASVEAASSTVYILLAVANPTLWALVVGGVISSMMRAGASFLLPSSRHKPAMSVEFAWEIFRFGRWIFVASLVTFLSMNLDRLFLGKVAPLAIVGVYGLARSIAELPAMLAVRLSYLFVFPLISSSRDEPRADLRRQLAPLRFKLLLLGAFGLSAAIAVSDLLVEFVYDDRYRDAAWMLPLLLLGVWGSVLSSLNEAILLAYGRPLYTATANSLRLGYLAVGLPSAFFAFGVLGAIAVVATSDLFRYGFILYGQIRERFTFGRQDAAATVLLLGFTAAWMAARWWLGYGSFLEHLPVGPLQERLRS